MKLCASVAGGLGIQVRRLVYRDGTASCLNPPVPLPASLPRHPPRYSYRSSHKSPRSARLFPPLLASTSARAASSFLVQPELPASVSFAGLFLLAANVPRFYLYLPLSFSLPFLTSLRTLVPQIAAIPPRARCPPPIQNWIARSSIAFSLSLPHLPSPSRPFRNSSARCVTLTPACQPPPCHRPDNFPDCYQSGVVNWRFSFVRSLQAFLLPFTRRAAPPLSRLADSRGRHSVSPCFIHRRRCLSAPSDARPLSTFH